MNKTIYYSAILIVFLSAAIFAQDIFKDERLRIDEDLIYSEVHVTDKNDNVIKGLLQGIRGDTLYLFFDRKLNGIDLKDLSMVTVYDERYRNTALTYSMLTVLYLANAIFFTSPENPVYIERFDTGELFLELNIALAAGVFGHFIGRSSGGKMRVFIFTESNDEEIKQFKDFVEDKAGPKKLHLNFSMTFVNSRLKEAKNSSQPYSSSHNRQTTFNVFRRITAAYQLWDHLAVGAGIANFGEPYIDYFYNSDKLSQNASLKYDGFGYYLIVLVPFRVSERFELNFTGGAGSGKIDFSYRAVTKTWVNYNAEESTYLITINKSVFSYLAAAGLSYYLLPGVSLSAQADYVYIPEKMPPMIIFNNEKTFSNFSFGAGIGYHF